MKKRYIIALMSAFLCSSVFFMGCGKNVSDPVTAEDDDEDDDEEDEDDDEDNDEDDEDVKKVYVESIDDDTLLSQIKVFVRNKKLWTVRDDMTVALEDAAYCVADLDHNGRAEVIVLTENSYASVTDFRIYEITENGDAFREADWNFSGIDDVCSSQVPDLIYNPFSEYYYDDKKEVSHYLMTNSFDNGNGEYGNLFCDLGYSGGSADVFTYACVQVNTLYDPDTLEYDYTYTFRSDKGEIDADEYDSLIVDYPDKWDKKDVRFGVCYRGTFDDPGVMGLDDAYLAGMLTDSYRVFTGEFDYADFYKKYNDPYAPGSSQDETYYEQYIGMWGLYSVEIEGDEQFYNPSSPQYSTLELTDDSRAIMTQYRDGEVSLRFECDVEMDEEMRPYFDYDDASALPEGFVNERYTIVGMNYDGDVITVYLDFYGEDGMLGGSTIKFLKNYTEP